MPLQTGHLPEVHLLGRAVPDIVADHRLVCLELVEGLVQHLAGFLDHVLPGPFALLDLLHVRFDRLGHVGPGDRCRHAARATR